jgi:hypothetical protein
MNTFGARLSRRPVGGIAEVRHLEAHSGGELERAAIAQLAVQFALKDKEDVAAIAPVVRQVAGRVLDDTNPYVADFEGAP